MEQYLVIALAIAFIIYIFYFRDKSNTGNGPEDLSREISRLMERGEYSALEVMLTEKAQQGSGFAAQALGELYSNDEFGMLDLEKSEHWYKRAGEMDEKIAAVQRALLSFNAHPVLGEDKEHFESLLMPGAEAGDAEMQAQLGAFYLRNPLKDPDSSQALYWLEKAAAQGNADAKTQLGIYFQSPDKGNDQDQARQLLQEASDGSSNLARFELATQLIEERGSSADINQAILLLEACATEVDAAKTYLANLYFRGQVIDRDLDKAEFWYREAGRDNPGITAYFLAQVLLEKKDSGSQAEAIELLMPLAENWVSHAQFLLAQVHENGWGVRRHLPTAWLYYRLAASFPIPEYVQARDAMGERLGQYEKTTAEESYQDFIKRFPISQQAQANMDHDMAMRLLVGNSELKQDLPRAVELLERALRGGNQFVLETLAKTCLQLERKVDSAVWAKLYIEHQSFFFSSGEMEAMLDSLLQNFSESEEALYQERLAYWGEVMGNTSVTGE